MSQKNSTSSANDFRKGRILVFLQFGLLGLLVFMPNFATSRIPGLSYLVGQFLFFAGILIVVLGFRSLGSSLTANPVPLEKAVFVNTGIFRWVRHPIYLGLLTLTFGMVLYKWSWPHAVVWCALVSLLQYKMQWEEKLLVAKYPAYANYAKVVPAIFPKRPDNSMTK